MDDADEGFYIPDGPHISYLEEDPNAPHSSHVDKCGHNIHKSFSDGTLTVPLKRIGDGNPSDPHTIHDDGTPSVPQVIRPDQVDLWKQLRFDDTKEAFCFYSNFAKTNGFKARVRSRLMRKSKKKTPNVLHYLRFVCSKAGHNKESDSASKKGCSQDEIRVEAHFEKQRDRPEVRCGCGAFIVFTFIEEEKKYGIREWVDVHSGHEMIPSSLAYLQTANRQVSMQDGLLAELNDRVGVSLDTSYRLMCRGVGGPQNLGCLKVDLKNHLQTRRKTWMNPSEGVCIQQHLKNTALRNPGFYYEIQYDAENLITNIFWADQRMIMDYSLFGDAVAFDTTFRTNKSYRPLGLFAGFNHHRQIIIFGAALLLDETIPSFEWLFSTFSTCMGSKLPLSIFTDQDAAMDAALRSTYPTVPHFLCTWHILQNAKKNLHNAILCDVTNTLCHLMYHVENVVEFDYVWNEMMGRHFSSSTTNVGFSKSKTWLTFLLTKREQWSNCYVNKAFTAGMRTTQASESVNGTARTFLKSDHRLLDFFPHFEEMIETLRHRENVKEFESHDKQPLNRFRSCSLTSTAARVYTPTIMVLFHNEREQAMEYIITECPEEQTTTEESWLVYKLNAVHHHIDKRVVHYNPTTASMRCTCSKFESLGILCRHIIQFMVVRGSCGVMELRTLPPVYLKKRWCRNVRGSYEGVPTTNLHKFSAPNTYVGRYQRLTASTVTLASLASYNMKLFEEVSIEIGRLIEATKVSISNSSEQENCTTTGDQAPQTGNAANINNHACSGLKLRKLPIRSKKRLKSVTENIHQQLRAKHQRARRKMLLEEERSKRQSNSAGRIRNLLGSMDGSGHVEPDHSQHNYHSLESQYMDQLSF